MRRSISERRGFDILVKFSKFALVGFGGVLVNTGALLLLYQFARLPLVAASPLAVEAAIVHNFLWNNRWTFGESTASLVRFVRFNLVSLGGLVITTVVLYLLVTLNGMNYLVANLLAIALATVWNFGLSLYWTWGWDR